MSQIEIFLTLIPLRVGSVRLKWAGFGFCIPIFERVLGRLMWGRRDHLAANMIFGLEEYIYVCVCVCVCVCGCVCMHACVNACIHMYICMFPYLYVLTL